MRSVLVALLLVLASCGGIQLQAAKDRLRDVALNVEYYGGLMDSACEAPANADVDALCVTAAVRYLSFESAWYALQSAASAAAADDKVSGAEAEQLTQLLYDLTIAERDFVLAVQALVPGAP